MIHTCTLCEVVAAQFYYSQWPHRNLMKTVKFSKTNVCSAEKLTKRSSNTVLRLVSFSAEQTLTFLQKSFDKNKSASLEEILDANKS